MSGSRETGCDEYKALSRRQFLSGTVKGAVVASFIPAWIPKVAFASSDSSSRDVIVSIFGRGAFDGLTLCVPYGEAAYYRARPTIAIAPPSSTDPNSAVDLDGFFGLPPAMSALLEAYQSKNLLLVHGAGSVASSHSHFDAQRYMEVGKPEDLSLTTGWLGRHLATAPPFLANAPLRALSLANALPTTLAGSPLALPVPNPASFGLGGASATRAERVQWLSDVYGAVDDPVKAAAENTTRTFNLLARIGFSTYKPSGGAVYPPNGFGNALKSAAALIKAQVGVEAIHIDIGGWDTHSSQGPVSGGMATNMKTLAGALAAFHADIASGTVTNVTTAVVSEFGRTVHENASKGTDHGHGNVMFLMGSHIDGGRVLAKWPGLDLDQLYLKQDLQVTIDYRDILAEVVQKRLGNSALSSVFPDHSPKFYGVTKA